MRRTLLTALAIALVGCAAMPLHREPAGPAKVNPASIAAAPAIWDGREIEVIGLLVWEFEKLRLYQSYGTYCREAEKSSIAVDWDKWPGVSRVDNRRVVMLRGTFTNLYGVPRTGGKMIIGAGPGPLEPGSVVRWLSRPAKSCPKALP
jgi:hypothetical protein